MTVFDTLPMVWSPLRRWCGLLDRIWDVYRAAK